jgi:hypothetical protein
MTWDIRPGSEQEYFEFVVREFIPEIQQLGLEPTDAWVTVYGDKPQILTSARVGEESSLNSILISDDWDKLLAKLSDFVDNLEYKLVHEKPGFQM